MIRNLKSGKLDQEPASKGAFARKQTERGKKVEPITPHKDDMMQSKDTAMTADEKTSNKPKGPNEEELAERKNLAEIHKRIRLEKQNTGKVLSVAEAKQLVDKEQGKTRNVAADERPPRKQPTTVVRRETTSIKRQVSKEKIKSPPMSK